MLFLLQHPKAKVSFKEIDVFSLKNNPIENMDCNIDLSYIQEIVGDDPEVLKEFIADIIVQMGETDYLLKQQIKDKNIGGVARAAHKLKSSLKVIGAEDLYQKLHQLEQAADNTKVPDEILSLTKVIEVLSNNCREKLQALI